MKKSVLAGVAVVVVLAIGWYAYAATQNKAAAPSASTETAASNSGSDIPVAGMTITYDDNGFSPSKITLQAGQTVTFQNNSSSDIQPSSDPHPSHSDNPELNLGTVAAGKSKTVTLKKVGTWGYHNHFDQSMAGTIVVQ